MKPWELVGELSMIVARSCVDYNIDRECTIAEIIRIQESAWTMLNALREEVIKNEIANS